MGARVLIVDDDAAYARTLKRSLERAGHEVAISENAREARALFDELQPEVIVLDYQLPDADGLALLDELRPRRPGSVFLLNTAYPDLEVAVDAMRRGAFDYVGKDATPRECLMRIERAAEVARLRSRVEEASRGPTMDGLVGESPPMKKLRRQLEALAMSSDTTAFIVGETGTGKGVIARQIHARSERAFEPFVAVDCTTIPATLVESELFGHEKVRSRERRTRSAGASKRRREARSSSTRSVSSSCLPAPTARSRRPTTRITSSTASLTCSAGCAAEASASSGAKRSEAGSELGDELHDGLRLTLAFELLAGFGHP